MWATELSTTASAVEIRSETGAGCAAADAVAWGAMSNAGQTCVGVERVYVAEAVYHPFMEKLNEQLTKLRPGEDDGASYGPMTLPGQVDVVERHLADAAARGGRAAIDERVYPDLERFWSDAVAAYGEELRRLGNLQLVSGMPAEVFLQTGSRTMMSYLLKPITDQLQRTFSER